MDLVYDAVPNKGNQDNIAPGKSFKAEHRTVIMKNSRAIVKPSFTRSERKIADKIENRAPIPAIMVAEAPGNMEVTDRSSGNLVGMEKRRVNKRGTT